jgi:cytochrome P450
VSTRIAQGPKPTPVVGNLLQFRRDRLGFLTDAARTHGDAVRLRMGPWPVLLLSHPDAVREVLVTHQHAFRKGPVLQRARLVLGDGLLTSEGDIHRRHRRLMNAAFHPGRLAASAAAMVEAADGRVRGWVPGTPVDVHRETVRSTLEVAGKTLFDTDVAADVDAIEAALADVLSAYRFVLLPFGWLLQRLPVGPMRRLRRGTASLDAIVRRMVAEHRAAGGQRGDLLSALLAHAESGDLSEQEVRDEAITLLLAGHETTANALAFACHLLASHAEVQDRLNAEVQAACTGPLPTHGDVARLPYTRAVLAEALRLYPPSWAMGRQAVRAQQVGGVDVPDGGVVILSQWVVHRDPRWWVDPDEFRPERWTSAGPAPRHAFFPFGGGTRQCIGEAFAWTEGVLSLAVMASRWRLRPADRPLRLDPLLTLRPADGVWVVPERRRPGA